MRAAVCELTDDYLIGELRRRGYLVVERSAGRRLPGLTIWPGGRIVGWRGSSCDLTPREADVLAVLAERWPAPASTAALIRSVWGGGATANAPSVYVRYLRVKLPGLIATLPGGRGYRLDLGASSA